jgi:uncharacterized protein (DUF1697 family)
MGTRAAQRHLALMRGINVGGKHVLPMKELARLFERAGCADVETYIQSGNVLFTADAELAAGIAERIARDVERAFGFAVPVVVRSAAELRAAVRANPFVKSKRAPEALHVAFLAGRPAKALVAALDPKRSPGDEFAVVGREVFLCCPNGVARTKLTNAWFDSALGTTSTLRNWRTTTYLLERLEGGAKA